MKGAEIAACKHCAQPFQRNRSTRPRVYCTPECHAAAKRQAKRHTHKCADCHNEARYVRDGRRGRWLKRCARCEARHRRASTPTPPRTWYCGTCRHCGHGFVDNQPHRSFCSRACSRLHHKHLSKARRRSRVAKTQDDARVYRAAVFERDGWRCQLCGRMTLRAAAVPHPLAPTLDHIVPLAAGGKHVPENVQLAHYRCNARKGAAGSQQLRLIA